jgi:hypothetical protein
MTMPKVQEIFVYLAEGPDGDEGIAAGEFSSMGWVPLVAASPHVAELILPKAQMIAAASGCRIRLVRFTCREDLHTVEPLPRPGNA